MPSKSEAYAGRKKHYGLLFPTHYNALDVELHCFRVGRTVDQGGLGKAEHFWKVVALLWGIGNPVGNRTKIFIRNPWSEEMITDACEQRYLGIGGPAACSKSETFALWLIVNYLANPSRVLGVVLSTSLKEARKRIWGSMVDFVRAVPQLPLKIVDSQGLIRYESPTFKASDKASLALIAAERKQEKEAISKLIGMHNDLVIVVADELTELTESILEYAMPGGNLTSNPTYQFVGLSNPNGYYDPFAKIWKPKDGWTSITVDSVRWETEHGIGIHFDAMRSPNVLAGRTIYPFLPTLQKIEDAKKAEGGEKSIRFWRMIRGFMCPLGQEDLIYSEVDVVKYKGDEPARWNDEPVIHVAGLDPGFTNGGDRSIAFKATLGTTIDGVRTLCYNFYEELVADVTKVDSSHSEQICQLFKQFCERNKVSPYNAAVDSTGGGSPFCDLMNSLWSRDFLRVHFGGGASKQAVSLTDPKLGNELYHDRVTEIWYSGKELLRQGQLKGLIPAQIQEMSARKYGTTGADKKIYVESKKDMKFNTGGKSPDIADAGFIILALCRERLGFNAVVNEALRQTAGVLEWKKLRNKLNAFSRRS